MRMRLLPALLVPLVALPLSACGDHTPSSTSGADGVSVVVRTFEFRPDPIVVPAGTAITFMNDDAIDHTVTAGTRDDPAPEIFDGQLPERGATFELTLETPGTYDYFCRIHPGPGMTASITVR